MRLKLALSAAVASLLFAAPVLAEEAAPNAQTAPAGQEDRARRKEARMLRRLERTEQRLNRAVERGRLTREQADQFLSEARQLHDDARAQLQAGGGRLTDEQKQQLKQRHKALREKVHATIKAAPPPGT
jgi:protein CpxP